MLDRHEPVKLFMLNLWLSETEHLFHFSLVAHDMKQNGRELMKHTSSCTCPPLRPHTHFPFLCPVRSAKHKVRESKSLATKAPTQSMSHNMLPATLDMIDECAWVWYICHLTNNDTWPYRRRRYSQFAVAWAWEGTDRGWGFASRLQG